MTYLLDTNVISEVRKSPRIADSSVRAWFGSQDPESLYLSVVTIMEIELGIERIRARDQVQAHRLQEWFDDGVLGGFEGRILPVDLDVARRAAHFHVPHPRAERDSLIAATALAHGMTLATRNVKDVRGMGVALLNPWHHGA